MPERNGTGWKMATILGALLCTSIGILVGSIITSGDKLNDLALGQQKAITERISIQESVREISDNQNATVVVMDGIKTQVANLARAVDRLTERICYMQTGKPCPDTVRRD